MRKAKKQQQAPAASFGENRARLAAMARVGDGMGPWRPAVEVLREVEAVPTRFVQFDVATRVGGFPLSRIALVHGPSAGGKTKFSLGVGGSFLAAGHFFGLLDAERTTPPSWLRHALREYADHPGMRALPVSSYEAAVDGVRQFCTSIADARKSGALPEDTTGIVVVDSIRKLVPKDLLKRLLSEGAEGGGKRRGFRKGGKVGVDGLGGRAAQHKAALNAAWMDELVPLLADTRCSVLIVAREETTDDGEVKVGGGRALVYDASLRCQVVEEQMWEGDGQDRHFVGEKHVVAIRKTKLTGKIEPVSYAAFYTSNGSTAPEGWWPERDLVECALELGVVATKGSWYSFDGKRLGQGLAGVLKRFADEPELVPALEVAVRASATKKPEKDAT
jgi:recombination protein RecA